MRPPRCGVCGADVGEAGALVDFVPREDDLEWHRRACAERLEGAPPDAVWLCGRHVRCGRMLSARFDVVRGLEVLALADEGIDVRGQVPPELGVEAWARILRRALPDFAIELGSDDVELDVDAQSAYYEDEEIPPGAANGVDVETWAVHGHLARVAVDVTSIYWRGGGLARTDVHIGSVSPHSTGFTVWVEPAPGARSFTSANVTMSGEPSPLMVELLARYGLEPATVTR